MLVSKWLELRSSICSGFSLSVRPSVFVWTPPPPYISAPSTSLNTVWRNTVFQAFFCRDQEVGNSVCAPSDLELRGADEYRYIMEWDQQCQAGAGQPESVCDTNDKHPQSETAVRVCFVKYF